MRSDLASCPRRLPFSPSLFSSPESTLTAIQLSETQLNRMQADLRVSDSLNGDDVRAVHAAQWEQARVDGQVDLAHTNREEE